MDDITARESNDAPKKTKKSKNVTLVMNRKVFTVLVAVIVLVVVFFLGSAYGSRNSDDDNTTRSSSSDNDNRPSTSNRWTSVGTIVEVSDSKLKIKDSRDQEKEAVINKETKIVNRKGEALAVKDLKKDQRVIASGDKDGDKLTATRIRLQQ